MSTCRVCGEPLKLRSSGLAYGARVHVCPKCRTPYVDPRIVELAAVPESDRAGHRLRYSTEENARRSLIIAGFITIVNMVFLSGALVQGFLPILLLFLGNFLGANILSFLVKFFVVFPKMIKASKKRMADTFYLMQMKAGYIPAA